MPEESEETEGTQEEESHAERELAGAALQSALRKERQARSDAEKRVKDLEARFKKIEDAEKSETERLRAELDELRREAEAERTRNEQERAQRQRGDTVRRAAKDFADSEDAVAILSARGLLDEVEDEREAERLVKALAKEKPHLLKQQAPRESGLEQVLKDGKPVEKSDDTFRGRNLIPNEQFATTPVEELGALKESDPERYWAQIEQLGAPETAAGRMARRVAVRR